MKIVILFTVVLMVSSVYGQEGFQEKRLEKRGILGLGYGGLGHGGLSLGGLGHGLSSSSLSLGHSIPSVPVIAHAPLSVSHGYSGRVLSAPLSLGHGGLGLGHGGLGLGHGLGLGGGLIHGW